MRQKIVQLFFLHLLKLDNPPVYFRANPVLYIPIVMEWLSLWCTFNASSIGLRLQERNPFLSQRLSFREDLWTDFQFLRFTWRHHIRTSSHYCTPTFGLNVNFDASISRVVVSSLKFVHCSYFIQTPICQFTFTTLSPTDPNYKHHFHNV